MAGSALEPIRFDRRIKYSIAKGVHRLMSMLPYEGAGEEVDPELDASVRESEQGLVIAPSLVAGAGMGLFSDREYEPGQVVCTYLGRGLTPLQMLRTSDWTYIMDLGKDRRGRRIHIDARHQPRFKASYVNHHFDRDKINVFCEELPDARKCLLLASRRILSGEELYMDYGTKYWHVVRARPLRPRQAPASSTASLRHAPRFEAERCGQTRFALHAAHNPSSQPFRSSTALGFNSKSFWFTWQSAHTSD